MIQNIKNILYFPIASYFRYFAGIRLRKWNPMIILVTGSSGKTTLLHLIESQLGEKAKYSHEANSSFGIPFDILGIHRKDLVLREWANIIVSPILNIFKPLPKEKIYVVEADCDRPNEGKFLSNLLMPNIVLWTNITKTHSMNFGKLVSSGKFSSIETAIAHEFGYFIESAKDLVMINSDSEFELNELKRTKASIEKFSIKKSLKEYNISKGKTKFKFDHKEVSFNYLMPREAGLSVLMCMRLIDYLKEKFDPSFSKLILPPGRNSTFEGIRGITIVDSSYNANLGSMSAVINMFSKIKSDNKWIVLGDMIELGEEEMSEHIKLSGIISKHNFQRVILMGPRVTKYTYPELKKNYPKSSLIEHFLTPPEVLKYLKDNIGGKEVILFKGARFLEGVIENLLVDKKDTSKLVRREKVWEIRRKKWGL